MDGKQILTIPNLSAWLLFVWGVVCSNPYTSLFEKNLHLYAPMASLVNSELFWGPLFASIGALGMLLGYLGRTTMMTKLMFGAYISFAVLYGMGDYSQPGMYFFGSFAIANALYKG